MPAKFTNLHNVPLPFAVLLATDDYDMIPAENKISVTTLIKSPRQVILSNRITGTEDEQLEDISNLVSSSIGSAIHGGLERAWLTPHKALAALGYPKRVIDRVKVNPTEPVKEDFNVFTELRTEKPFMGYTVSGCADLILNEQVQDYKTTGIFAWTSQSNFKKYQLQLSIYRWLNPNLITSDVGIIHYFFRDWSKLDSSFKVNYPKLPILAQDIPLFTLSDTEKYIANKLNQIKEHWNSAEPDIPLCSKDDLWQDDPKWQYFGTVGASRASKNFGTQAEAMAWRNQKGKGEVKHKAGKAKACNYCSACHICSQARMLREQKLLD